ncbi:hypothetical protein D1007_27864 [Hordeum vulgare]|nr:hypothetical protein D1007_27864 [Hordeum vulgare]
MLERPVAHSANHGADVDVGATPQPSSLGGGCSIVLVEERPHDARFVVAHEQHSVGWAPSSDLVPPMVIACGATLAAANPVSHEAGPAIAIPEVTTSQACMLWPDNVLVSVPAPTLELFADSSISPKEQVVLANIKSSCVGLLKKLALPLLKEFEGLCGVKAGKTRSHPHVLHARWA